MSKVAILTDSTTYLPDELVREYNITVLPLSIIWEGVSYRDGVDIQPDEFYRRLQNCKELPTTSQVTAPAMQEAFSALLEQGHEVLGIFLSAGLSGTLDSATQARNALASGREKVAVVDSRFTTMAMGLPVLMAARAAQAGESLAACQQVVEQASHQTGVLFVVETLEFMRRGGRIGGAQAFLGTALNIKPVLGMRDGQIEALEKVRKKSAAEARLIEIVKDRIDGRRPVRLAASHAAAEAEASALLAAASAQISPIETFCRPLSPVIGSHVGPGTVALAYMTGMA